MMKKALGIIILLCSCCFLFGCSSSVSSVSEDFCDALFGGKYEDAAAMMSGVMRREMGEEETAGFLSEVEAQYGAYESSQFVASETAQGYTFATVEIQCAEGLFQAVICLDDDRIEGVQIYSDDLDEEKTSDAEITADAEIASAFAKALFSGDYETAASFMSEEYSKTMNQTACAALITEANASYGAFVEVGAVSVTGDTAHINVVFEQKSVIFAAVFNGEGSIDSFTSLGEGQ